MTARSPSIPAALLAALLSLPTAAGSESDPGSPARDYRERQGARILREFAALLTLPNVASDEANIRRNAEFLQSELERRGVRTELWTLPGAPPLVYGELEVEGATRTLGLYAHYDGQPVDVGEWAHPPWSPALYTAALEAGGRRRPFPVPRETIDPEWRIYARSAGDDKAPIAALLAAFDALAAAGVSATSNFKFLFEGEEEAGSPHLGLYLSNHRDRLDVDLWLICDGPVHQSRRPQLVFGVRGYTGLDLTVYGASRYLHSGHYGNWAPNPAQRLARLLGSMKDDEGKVLIEGFYDGTAPITEAERRAIAALPDYDDELRLELDLAATEAGNAPLAERLLLPSLNVRGLAGGAVGESARNVIPTEATASLDIRLALGNYPEEMLDRVEEHIRRQGYSIGHGVPDPATRRGYPKLVRVERRKGYPAARTPVDLPVVQPVVAAVERAAGEPPLLVPTMGGSLPLYLFTELLGRPIVIVPIANHDDNQHAPNENLRIANFWYGIDLMAELLTLP